MNDVQHPDTISCRHTERKSTINDVQHPDHYTWRGTECTKAIEIMTNGTTGADAMYIGNIVKYLYRYPAKGTPLKDLMKARQYLDFLIASQEARYEKVRRKVEKDEKR